jgi:tetratricopeptide (TPR) repeat protein
MTGLANENARKTVLLWCAAVVLLLVLTEAVNVGLRAFARERRVSDYRTYLVAATGLMNQYDYMAALSQVEDAKRRNADAPEPYALAGHIRYQLKQWNQAIQEYKAAIAHGSREEGVFLNVVWALIELNRYEEAAALGKKTITAGFSVPALPRYTAEAYFRDGKKAEAIPFYEMALKGYPNDLYLLDHLRQSYRAAGQLDKAKEMQARIADIEASLNSPR